MDEKERQVRPPQSSTVIQLNGAPNEECPYYVIDLHRAPVSILCAGRRERKRREKTELTVY